MFINCDMHLTCLVKYLFCTRNTHAQSMPRAEGYPEIGNMQVGNHV